MVTPFALAESSQVSIQLVSPASGENVDFNYLRLFNAKVSIQLVSPASGETSSLREFCRTQVPLFPFN